MHIITELHFNGSMADLHITAGAGKMLCGCENNVKSVLARYARNYTKIGQCNQKSRSGAFPI